MADKPQNQNNEIKNSWSRTKFLLIFFSILVVLALSGNLIVAEDAIVADPQKYLVVSGTGGVRKARAARAGSGKSGGANHLFLGKRRKNLFPGRLPKNEKENLSGAEKKVLKAVIAEMKEEAKHA